MEYYRHPTQRLYTLSYGRTDYADSQNNPALRRCRFIAPIADVSTLGGGDNCILILWTEVHGIPWNDQVIFIQKIARQSKKDKHKDDPQNFLTIYHINLHV